MKVSSGLLTVGEAAEYLRLTKSTIYSWVHYKKIRFAKIGSRVLFRVTDLDEMIERNFSPINGIEKNDDNNRCDSTQD